MGMLSSESRLPSSNVTAQVQAWKARIGRVVRMGESSDELKLGAAGSRHESLLAEGQLRSASLSSWGDGCCSGKAAVGKGSL